MFCVTDTVNLLRLLWKGNQIQYGSITLRRWNRFNFPLHQIQPTHTQNHCDEFHDRATTTKIINIELTDCHHCVWIGFCIQIRMRIKLLNDQTLCVIIIELQFKHISAVCIFFATVLRWRVWLHNTFLIDVVIRFFVYQTYWLSQVNDYSFHISFRQWHFSLDNMFIYMARIKSINHISIHLD